MMGAYFLADRSPDVGGEYLLMELSARTGHNHSPVGRPDSWILLRLGAYVPATQNWHPVPCRYAVLVTAIRVSLQVSLQ